MNRSIRDNIGFQQALQAFADQLAIATSTDEADTAYGAQVEAQTAAYEALTAVIDAHTSRVMALAANAKPVTLRAA